MRIVSINVSEKKGVQKKPVAHARIEKDHGIIGDAHAGSGDRQISLLSIESIDEFKKSPNLKGCIHHGVFGENLTTEGVDLENIGIGSRLKIGSVILQITKKGKECRVPCQIYHRAGDCIMPKKGVFARVIEGGIVKVLDQIVLLS